MKIVITGYGIVTSLGIGVQENLKCLMGNERKLSNLQGNLFSTHKKKFYGEIAYTNSELIETLERYGIEVSSSISRTSLLGAIAVREAIRNSEIENDENTGLISSTTVGNLDLGENIYEKYLTAKIKPEEKSDFLLQTPGESSNQIAKLNKVEGFVTTLSTACSSSANAIMYGSELLKTKHLDKVIVGGTDALCKFTINGFNSLMILDDELCKPLSKNRKGLNLGEGAAYIVMEREEDVKDKSRIKAVLSGYGNANDAFHHTGSSPDGLGASLAMKNALSEANLSPLDIDYINAHGTGTINNDLSEGKAIQNLFESVPFISSTKGYTGHTLAAAGSVEVVFSLLSIKHKILWSNIGFTKKIEELKWKPLLKNMKLEPKHILSNSLGFGGNCSSIILSKY